MDISETECVTENALWMSLLWDERVLGGISTHRRSRFCQRSRDEILQPLVVPPLRLIGYNAVLQNNKVTSLQNSKRFSSANESQQIDVTSEYSKSQI